MKTQIIIFLFLVMTGNLRAEDLRVSGKITNRDGEELSFANVVVKNTRLGAASGEDGAYSLQVPAAGKYTFLIRYVGHEPVEKTCYVRGDTSINFKLHEDAMNLGEVVVTGTRTPRLLKDAPVITRVITSEDIKAVGAVTVQDLLEIELPGLEFVREMDNQMAINMQGMSGKYVLFLIDGERMAGETLNNVDYGRLNVANIERVEIVKGAASALYGSNAIGGVVNIITKDASEPWQVNVNGRYGAHNEQVYGATVGLKQGKFNSLTDFTRKKIDSYTLTDAPVEGIDELITTSIFGNKDYAVNEKLTYRPTEQLRITAKGGYYHHERDFSVKTKNRSKDYNAGLNVNHAFSTAQNLEVAYVFDRYEKSDYYTVSKVEEPDYRNTQHTARLQYNYSFREGNTLTAGAEFFNETLMTYQFKQSGDGSADGEHSTNTSVVFLQHDWNVATRLNLLYGARMDYHSTFGAHVSPKASLMYRYSPFTFRLSYSGGFRSPSLKELYTDWYHSGGDGFQLVGNENLEPETSHNFSASGEYTRGRVNLSLVGYCNNIHDKIGTLYKNKQPGQLQDSSFYRNIGKAVVSGVDANLLVRCPYGFGVRLSYSYVHDKQKSDGVNISQTRPHSATFRLDYSLQRKRYALNAVLSGRLLGHLNMNSLVSDATETTPAVYEKISYPAYTMWKLVVTQQVMDACTLTLGVDNLFNYRPEQYSFNSTLSSGTTFFAGISVNIERIFKKR